METSSASFDLNQDSAVPQPLSRNGKAERQDERNSDRLARIAAQIDQTIGAKPTPIPAPSYAAPQRDAVNSVVDHLVHDVIENIAALKKKLKELEQQVLSAGAAAKENLTAQMEVCSRVREQCHQIGDVISTLNQKLTGMS